MPILSPNQKYKKHSEENTSTDTTQWTSTYLDTQTDYRGQGWHIHTPANTRNPVQEEINILLLTAMQIFARYTAAMCTELKTL